jgi:hypothetical protein
VLHFVLPDVEDEVPHLLSTDLQLWVNLGRDTWPKIEEVVLQSQTDEEDILRGYESESAEVDEVEEVEEVEMQMDSEDEHYNDFYDDDYDMYGGYESPWLYDSDELEEIIWSFK